MSKRNKPDSRGFVYSTDPDFKFEQGSEHSEIVLPAMQKIRVSIETKHRGGKAVTLVKGFVGTSIDLEELEKKLKGYCGTGGAVKDGEVIIQGNQRDKVLQWLHKNNYKQSK